MYTYLYVGLHWPVWSVSTQFPSLQDAPDLGWDYKFVDNITDLLTWVHVKGRNTSSYTAPDPRLSQHTGNIIGYGSFLCLPCLPTPTPQTSHSTGFSAAFQGPRPHIPVCASLPAWPHHRLSGKKDNFAQLESDPKENRLSFLTKTNMKSGLWAAGHMATQRRLFSASSSYLSFINPENVAWPLKQLNTGSEMPKRRENRRSTYSNEGRRPRRRAAA